MVSKEPKILLVDDDELSRRMMGLLLSDKGYNYDTASNGVEAVAAVQSQSYDLVLMDLQMPVMDGFEATRAIREWEAGNTHTSIVALTAMLFEDEMKNCLSVGMDECIAKPFNSDTLFQLISSYVDKSEYKSEYKSSSKETQTNHAKDKPGEQVVLDVEDTLPRFGKDFNVYKQFLSEFVSDLKDRINQFQTVFLSGDFESLADQAHNLKGVSASMGAKQLSSLSQVLDQRCQKGDSLLIQETLEEIEKHVPELLGEAAKILSEKAE